MSIKEELENLIANDELKEALNQLLKKTKNHELYNEILIIHNRFESLQSLVRRGIIDERDRLVEKNKILQSLIEITADIELVINNTTDKENKNRKSQFIKNITPLLLIIFLFSTLLFVINKYKAQLIGERTKKEKSSLYATQQKVGRDSIIPNAYGDIKVLPPNSYEFQYSQKLVEQLTGDFDGDGEKEKAFIYLDVPQNDGFMNQATYIFQIANSKFGILKINKPYVYFKNVGDLNDDNGDEISIAYFAESRWGTMDVITFDESRDWHTITTVGIRSDSEAENRIIKEGKGYFKIIEDTWDKHYENILLLEKVVTN